MDKRLNRLLKQELQNMPALSQAHLDETVRLCRAAYETRRRMRRIGTLEMIVRQLPFVARPIWALQGAVLLIMCWVLHLAVGTDQIPALLSLTAVFAAMTMLPFYGRARKYKMREIESAARISHARLALAKLCAVGIGDAVFLSAAACLSLGTLDTPLRTVLLFLVLPFLLTCAGSLFALNRLREEYGIYVSAALGAGIAVAYWQLAAKHGGVLTRLSTPLAVLACGLLLLALGWECRKLLHQMPAADLQEALLY